MRISERTDSEVNYIRAICELGLKNQRLMSRYLDYQLIPEVRHLQEIDRQLTGLLHKAGFNPSQPRVPAGNPDGGQWTGGRGGYSVSSPSKLKVIIHHPSGSSETRTGGSRSWRNNNPGNLRSGTFANNHGAVGSAGGFAVFPDEATGDAASEALLRTSTYSRLTIHEAIARRSPSSENDTRHLQNLIRQIGGFSGNEVIGELNDNQMSRLTGAIKRTEGWIPGGVIKNPRL